MADRNLFDTLYFKQASTVPPVIDLTDDLEDSEEEEQIMFPDSFSSSVGKILNERSISAVLSNVEVFYKSQIEYLEDNRYEKPTSLTNNPIFNTPDDDLQFLNISDKKDLCNGKHSNSTNNSFSAYYFIKQTFNCPVVLIDHLINTMTDMKLKDDDIEIECPKQIEIDIALDTDKSNIITKKDLRMLTFYKPPKPKKPRTSSANKATKHKPNSHKKEPTTAQLKNFEAPTIEVIEISDSDDESDLVDNGFDEIDELVDC